MTMRLPYTQIDKQALGPRLSVAGYVKIGGKRRQVRWSQRGPYVLPTSYTDPVRFEVTTREKDAREVERNGTTYKVDFGYRRDEEIHEKVGEAPKKLDVRLMFPTAEQNFVCHFGAHSGKRWVCQGNGVEATDITRGKVSCPCPRLEQFEGGYEDEMPPEKESRGEYVPCKPRGVLSVVLEAAETFGRFHVFKTTSWESIANIRTQLEIFEQQWGRLDGLPLKLVVYPATKSYGHGEGVTTQPIVTLEVAASFETARQLGADAIEETRRLTKAAGGSPDPDDHRDILRREMQEEAMSEGGEYFPETRTGGPDRPGLQERIDRKKTEESSPVVQAEAPGGSEEPERDYEIVEEEATPEEVPTPEVEEPGSEAPQEGADAPSGGPEDAGSTGGEKDQGTPELDSERDRLNRKYFALLGEERPGWGDVERKFWQEQKIGKASCRDWDTEDFELAILLIRKGRLDVDLPEDGDGDESEEGQEALDV